MSRAAPGPLRTAWLIASEQIRVPDWLVAGGQLQDPVEHHAAAGRAAAVEPEDELVEIGGQVRGVNRALVGAQQPPLAQRGDAVDCGQQAVRVLSSCAGRLLVDGPVLISLAADGPVRGPAVGDDLRPRLDVLPDERGQRVTAGVIERRHPAAADAFRLANLHGDPGKDLLAALPAAAQTGLLAADVGLIDLDRAGQPAPSRADQRRAQPVQHRPRRLIGADLQRPLQILRRDAILGGREQPAGVEPHRQRGPGPVEDSPRRHRGP